jgi:hypothetical protein
MLAVVRTMMDKAVKRRELPSVHRLQDFCVDGELFVVRCGANVGEMKKKKSDEEAKKKER